MNRSKIIKELDKSSTDEIKTLINIYIRYLIVIRDENLEKILEDIIKINQNVSVRK